MGSRRSRCRLPAACCCCSSAASTGTSSGCCSVDCKPAFLTTRRGEVRERAVRTRRKPGGGKRREPLGARRRTCQIAAFTLRVTKHGFSGSLAVRHFFWSEPGPLPWFSRITRHETRITAFYRVLRPTCGEKCRLAPVIRRINKPIGQQRREWLAAGMCKDCGGDPSPAGSKLCKGQKLIKERLHFSSRGEAKWVRGPSGRGARRLARAGVLEQYVEHGKQAQRSPGGRIACFGRRVVRNAG